MFSNIFNNFSKKNFYFTLISLLLFWFVYKNIDITFMFFISIVFASSLSPLVDKLSKKMNRTLATSIVLFGSIFLLCLCIIPVIVLGAYQIGTFAEAFPNYINNLDDIAAASPLLQKLGIANIDMSNIVSTFANSASDIIGNVVDVAKNVSSAFLHILTAIIFIFFLILDKKVVKNNTLKLFPSELRKRTEQILDSISEKIGGYIIAQTCAILSVLIIMTLGLLIFRINYAVLLGLITAILDIIPVVGPAIALIICLIATYEAGFKSLLAVIVVFALAQFIENNFVRPYAYNKLLNLHPIIIFLSLFIGAKYGGVVGVLFAPPVATAICILLDELYLKKMD